MKQFVRIRNSACFENGEIKPAGAWGKKPPPRGIRQEEIMIAKEKTSDKKDGAKRRMSDVYVDRPTEVRKP